MTQSISCDIEIVSVKCGSGPGAYGELRLQTAAGQCTNHNSGASTFGEGITGWPVNPSSINVNAWNTGSGSSKRSVFQIGFNSLSGQTLDSVCAGNFNSIPIKLAFSEGTVDYEFDFTSSTSGTITEAP